MATLPFSTPKIHRGDQWFVYYSFDIPPNLLRVDGSGRKTKRFKVYEDINRVPIDNTEYDDYIVNLEDVEQLMNVVDPFGKLKPY